MFVIGPITCEAWSFILLTHFSGNSIYLFGGSSTQGGSSRGVREVEAFDTLHQTWCTEFRIKENAGKVRNLAPLEVKHMRRQKIIKMSNLQFHQQAMSATWSRCSSNSPLGKNLFWPSKSSNTERQKSPPLLPNWARGSSGFCGDMRLARMGQRSLVDGNGCIFVQLIHTIDLQSIM